MPTGQTSFFDQVHPEDRPRLIENAARNDADKTVQSFEHEVRVRCKDGSYRWVATNGRLLRDAEGKPVRVVGAIRDITKRREAEEKLAASEKRLRDILDSLYGFVGLYTLDGVLIDINRAPLVAAGFKAEDVLGKPSGKPHGSHRRGTRASARHHGARRRRRSGARRIYAR